MRVRIMRLKIIVSPVAFLGCILVVLKRDVESA